MSQPLTVPDAAPDGAAEYLSAAQLEALTGTPQATWRYWAMTGAGPASFKLGRRRVWRRSTVMAWITEQETAGGVGL